MEGTGRCALSSARPEFRYRPSRRRRIKEATTKAALLPPTHSRSERLSGPGKWVAGGREDAAGSPPAGNELPDATSGDTARAQHAEDHKPPIKHSNTTRGFVPPRMANPVAS